MKNLFLLHGHIKEICSSKITKIMRNLLILLFITVSQVFADDSYSQTTRLSLNLKDVSVESVLSAIEDQTEFYFLCNKKLVDVERKVSIQLENQNINEILTRIFMETDVDYLVSGRQIVLSPGSYLSEVKSALQPVTISGTVVDEQNNPLIGVTVSIKGTTKGTVTNTQGNYSIEVDDESDVLVYSYLGYYPQEVIVGNQRTIDIQMEPDYYGLEEVVAIGYGTQRKNDLTGSIASVNADELEATLNTNLLTTLQGTVGGLRITQNNFEPGASQEIRVRGENSLSAGNNPLIVLDGIPYEGDMNDINPSDIEAVSILKDASSAAIYGARAANGVILVTTKTGRQGKMRINYNGSLGLASVANKSIQMLDGDGYVEFIQEHIRQGGGPANQPPTEWMFSNEIPNYNAGTQTDWLDLVFRNVVQQDHLISFSGGTEDTKYYTSVGYLDQPGIVENSGFSRITLRSNIDHTLNEWLSIRSNLQFSQGDHGEGGVTPNISNAMRMSPYGKVKEDNGEYTFYPMYPEIYFPSPFANNEATVDDMRRRAIVNLFGEVNPGFLPGLSYILKFGANIRNHKYGSYFPSNSESGARYNGSASVNEWNSLDWTLENILEYGREFGDHSLNIVGLYSREANTAETSNLSGNGFVNDDNLYHYLESAEAKNMYTNLDEYSLISYMGRINYNYANKYFLTATARQDGYSGFGENNKYGFFPSVALGWTMSNESFMQNINALDFLKLRLSYGVNGNMAVGTYQTLDRLQTANAQFDDNTA